MCVCVHAHAHMAHNGHIRVSLHANMCVCMRRRAHLAKQRSHSMHQCATLLMQTCVCRRRQANASCVCRNMHCHAHLAAAGKKIRRFAAFVNLQAQNTTPLCTVRNKHMTPTHKRLRPPPCKHTQSKDSMLLQRAVARSVCIACARTASSCSRKTAHDVFALMQKQRHEGRSDGDHYVLHACLLCGHIPMCTIATKGPFAKKTDFGHRKWIFC